MRRFTLASAAAAIALTIAIPMSVDAGTNTDSDRRVAPATDRVEVLRLECGVRVADSGAVVGCTWSAPTSPRAVGVRLFRLDPATDPHRQVIFRTDDLGVTRYADAEVRPGHRYAYAVQAVDENGRVVGESRAEWVEVPKPPEVEVLRLACGLGSAHETIGCEWSRPTSSDVYVLTLWRSVDGGEREVVERFRPSGPNAYRDRVPVGASKVVYAVIATNEGDRIVARSRPATVRIPDVGPDVIDQVRPAASVAVESIDAVHPGPSPAAEFRLPADVRARILRLIRELAGL
jgi:hypothetical protein